MSKITEESALVERVSLALWMHDYPGETDLPDWPIFLRNGYSNRARAAIAAMSTSSPVKPQEGQSLATQEDVTEEMCEAGLSVAIDQGVKCLVSRDVEVIYLAMRSAALRIPPADSVKEEGK